MGQLTELGVRVVEAGKNIEDTQLLELSESPSEKKLSHWSRL